MYYRISHFAPLALSIFSPAVVVNALPKLGSRQIPANASGVNTITSPTGVQIRYKEPGEAGVCETTPGVKSYSGYVDLSPTSHTFFWFFEARHSPETAPLTLWLNGGPGSDSLIGLFQGRILCSFSSRDAWSTRLLGFQYSALASWVISNYPLVVRSDYITFQWSYNLEGVVLCPFSL